MKKQNKATKMSAKTKRLKEKQKQEKEEKQVIRPMSHRERCYAQKHGLFLLRNITKVRGSRQDKLPLKQSKINAATHVQQVLREGMVRSKNGQF